ncbi:MAG: NAD(P)(+) transhydrogenase (Re/Si-specific) subunit beta [Acidobacteriota bacterium]
MSSSFIGTTLVPVLYLLSAILFILGLKGLTKVRSAQRGNALAALAMLIAAVAALLEMGTFDLQWILVGLVVGGAIGAFAAIRVEMTGMPEMVALFNGSGGLSSALVAASFIWLNVIEKGGDGTAAATIGSASAITAVLSMFIGALTLSGSVVAYGKLSGKISGSPIMLPGRHVINLLLILGSLGLGIYTLFGVADSGSVTTYVILVMVFSLVLGVMLVIPIGGADMPVVISLLNSYSGLAASATGFVLQNNVLIISGALVGASGLILTQIMCVAMNRTLANVLLGGFGAEDSTGAADDSRDYTNVRSGGAEEAALVLENAESVVIVPGYGLAVAQAQHTVKELATELEKRGAKVTYGIHPVAGRMPGHMNVLLAEADVPYEQLLEMDVINPEFNNTDVVIVVGANDVVNPAAEKTPGSPIYGMPVLEIWNAASVIMIKRSLSPGYAGIKNELFEYDNTMMVFEDGKKAVQGMVTELKDL